MEKENRKAERKKGRQAGRKEQAQVSESEETKYELEPRQLLREFPKQIQASRLEC